MNSNPFLIPKVWRRVHGLKGERGQLSTVKAHIYTSQTSRNCNEDIQEIGQPAFYKEESHLELTEVLRRDHRHTLGSSR